MDDLDFGKVASWGAALGDVNNGVRNNVADGHSVFVDDCQVGGCCRRYFIAGLDMNDRQVVRNQTMIFLGYLERWAWGSGKCRSFIFDVNDSPVVEHIVPVVQPNSLCGCGEFET